MNKISRLAPRLLLAAIAASTCAIAGAQTIYSGQADTDRRDRNREEALANYHRVYGTSATASNSNSQVIPQRRKTMRERTHSAAEKTRDIGHRTAEKTRQIGHRTAEKARDITAKTEAKVGPNPRTPTNPVDGTSK